MESLGPMVSFFSQKVEEKVVLIRELSLKRSIEAHGRRGPSDSSGLQTPASFGLKNGVRVERDSETWLGDMELCNLQLIFFISLSRRIVHFDPWWRRS